MWPRPRTVRAAVCYEYLNSTRRACTVTVAPYKYEYKTTSGRANGPAVGSTLVPCTRSVSAPTWLERVVLVLLAPLLQSRCRQDPAMASLPEDTEQASVRKVPLLIP